MKKIILLTIVSSLFLASCDTPYIFNRVVKDSNGTKSLIGGFEKSALEEEPFSNWYLQEYDSYNVNQEMVKQFKNKLKGYRIEVFMGTWCGDSKRELPRFLRILDEAKFHQRRITMYAVNKKKQSFYGEEIGKEIKMVPTFIFYKGGKEVGRIVEYPASESLEEDILMIVNETPLTPNYAED